MPSSSSLMRECCFSLQVSETSHCRKQQISVLERKGFYHQEGAPHSSTLLCSTPPAGAKGTMSLQATRTTAQKHHFNIRNPVLLPGTALLTENSLLALLRGSKAPSLLLCFSVLARPMRGCAGPAGLSHGHKARAAGAPTRSEMLQCLLPKQR